jgi:hypothetical protein
MPADLERRARGARGMDPALQAKLIMVRNLYHDVKRRLADLAKAEARRRPIGAGFRP